MLKNHHKKQALLVKISDDLDHCRNFQQNLSVKIQEIEEELHSQKELTSRILELLTTKSSSSPNNDTISIEVFQRRPKLAGIHQLWWTVSIRRLFLINVFHYIL